MAKKTEGMSRIAEGFAAERPASPQPPVLPARAGNLTLLSESATGVVNTGMAFWEQRAYVASYSGFRIFDISDPARPTLLLSDVFCFGPQNDLVVWGHLLFLAVDAVLTGPECGSRLATDRTDPSGWEGVRIFNVSDPRNPEFITGMYTDCGAHTITAYPRSRKELLLYVSSYPLSPGPTCGPERGPAVGRDPLHGVIQVLRVPLDDPGATREVAEPPIHYPGDPDNEFKPSEHGLPAQAAPMRACHDIGVIVELRLAGGACAEQAQLWRIGRDGIPDTANPLWVFDDESDANGATRDPSDQEVGVDFWHSATFSWDGKVVNFVDESLGDGCPPVTPLGVGVVEPNADTGRMFFLDTKTGRKLSHFMIPRKEQGAYCSAHLGNTVRSPDRRLLVNAWYAGGLNVIDFDDPARPREIAWFDAAPSGPAGSDNWSAYWYEGPSLHGHGLPIYGNDGVRSPLTGGGFQTFRFEGLVRTSRLSRLNPQTQERALP